MFRFTARWKEELVVVGPGGSFILELPMGILTARLPTEQVWPTIAPVWAVDLWPALKAELERWCAASNADLEIDPTATVSPFYETSSGSSGLAIRVAGWFVATMLLVAAAWLLLGP
jgi:hypothetical protein